MRTGKTAHYDIPQDWSGLHKGQLVIVTEPGRSPYAARIDAMHENKVVWILADRGQRRQAFDYREGIAIASA